MAAFASASRSGGPTWTVDAAIPAGVLGEDDLALGLEGPADLDAEVDVHRRSGPGRVVIDEDVVAVGSKAIVDAQEGPHLVEGRPPG